MTDWPQNPKVGMMKSIEVLGESLRSIEDRIKCQERNENDWHERLVRVRSTLVKLRGEAAELRRAINIINAVNAGSVEGE